MIAACTSLDHAVRDRLHLDHEDATARPASATVSKDGPPRHESSDEEQQSRRRRPRHRRLGLRERFAGAGVCGGRERLEWERDLHAERDLRRERDLATVISFVFFLCVHWVSG
jgi:hypothetical protein